MMSFVARSKVADAEVKAMVGSPAKPEHFPIIVKGAAATVYKANGDLLCMVLPQAIPEDLKAQAYAPLRRLSNELNTNRGAYAGGTRTFKIRPDGTLSRSSQATPVRSTVAGYLDRSQRIPFCRPTIFTAHNPEAWGQMLPMVQHVAGLFAKHSPKRYAAQLEAANRTHPAYVIPKTPFTTLTINGTVAGAYHTDKGDYAPGLGVISVFRSGKYDGGVLGFPAYGVGVDLGDRDVILFDPHEIHGVLPFIAEGEAHKDFERISVVYYFRQKMVECLPPEEELAHVKEARGSIEDDDDEAATAE